MARQLKTAEEIRDEVHRRVHAVHEVRADGDEIGIPLPTWNEPDDTGCNWGMGRIRNPGTHMQAVERVVAAVQAEWNLRA
jgi:hypothetical protein